MTANSTQKLLEFCYWQNSQAIRRSRIAGETVKKHEAWGIPAEVIAGLDDLYGKAQAALTAAQEKETGQKPEAFGSEFAA